MIIADTKHAAEHLIDTVRSGKTALGKAATIRPRGYFTSGTYSARTFDVWVETPFGTHAQETYFMFFKRRFYESFGRNHSFKADSVGMSVSLIPLQEASKVNGYAIIVMEDGSIYDKRAREWINWCTEYENRGVIRTMKAQNNGAHLEASIGLSQLRKVYPL